MEQLHEDNINHINRIDTCNNMNRQIGLERKIQYKKIGNYILCKNLYKLNFFKKNFLIFSKFKSKDYRERYIQQSKNRNTLTYRIKSSN